MPGTVPEGSGVLAQVFFVNCLGTCGPNVEFSARAASISTLKLWKEKKGDQSEPEHGGPCLRNLRQPKSTGQQKLELSTWLLGTAVVQTLIALK